MAQNFELRDYQDKNADIVRERLLKVKIFAFVGEVRVGKTLTALAAAHKMGLKKVVFLTKKKAMSSIKGDYKLSGYAFELIVVNYESMHKIDASNADLIVCDESHGFSSFPKPSKRAKDVKAMIIKNKIEYTILLSGTFSPESYSQVYHQFWVSPYSPFADYKSFYQWAGSYVDKKKKRIGNFFVNDYSFAYEGMIDKALKNYILSFTQEQAGFVSSVKEEFHYIGLNPQAEKIITTLVRDKIVEGKDDVIIADSGAKMQQKCHQLYSGTIKLDSGNRIILTDEKAQYIKATFKNQRLALIYNFVAEGEAIKNTFGDNITFDIDEFHASDSLHFAGQIQSTKEGTNLSLADVLVMYNIAFSATAYFQARARLSTIERPETNVHWIFTKKGGFEDNIYKVVSKKKDYTLSYFRKYIKNEFS